MKTNTGFTLVELMIATAIIAILVGFALPTYQNYMVKAKVMEMLTLAQPTKLAITEALITGVPIGEIDPDHVGMELIKNKGVVKEMKVAAGVLTITGDAQKLGLSQGTSATLTLKPIMEGGAVSWVCASGGEEFRKLSPNNCQTPTQ